jgi:sec-independent protein translocase protein TatA
VANIGLPEMLVVLVVALIFLGPQRLPTAARQLGAAVREFRRVTGDLQAEVRDAFSDPGTYAGPPPLEDRKPEEA